MAVAREHTQGPIQAYAKLQGENFVYYVQTLELMLGRRVEGYTDVQVDLGPSRTISRQHAKIVYEFQTRRFMLHPLGKNGVVINGQHYTPGAVIPLDTKYAASSLFCACEHDTICSFVTTHGFASTLLAQTT
jgi:hypothetical protein